MESLLVWNIRWVRRRLERRMARGWNPALSLRIDRLMVAEEALNNEPPIEKNMVAQ